MATPLAPSLLQHTVELPLVIMSDRRLTGTQVRIYAALAARLATREGTREVSCSVRTLAAATGSSTGAVQRALPGLLAAGYVQRLRTGGGPLSSRYRLPMQPLR